VPVPARIRPVLTYPPVQREDAGRDRQRLVHRVGPLCAAVILNEKLPDLFADTLAALNARLQGIRGRPCNRRQLMEKLGLDGNFVQQINDLVVHEASF